MNKKIFLVTALSSVLLMACQNEDASKNTDTDVKVEETQQETQGEKQVVNEEKSNETETETETEVEVSEDEVTTNEEAVSDVVAENEAFRVVTPAPEQKVDGTVVVEGEARVFEGSFQYRLEDGHNVLDEGHAQTTAGAPEWGKFKFEINYEGASSPYATLYLFEGSPKDGSPQHELRIPLELEKFE